MSQFKNIVKQWFQKNDKPTEEQFAQSFDYIFFKDEVIPVSAIEGLIDVLNGKANSNAVAALMPIIASNVATVQIPAYTWVTAILIFSNQDAVVTVGTTEGGVEYSDGINITNGKGLIEYSYVTGAAAQTFYFSNVPQNAIIKIYKQ